MYAKFRRVMIKSSQIAGGMFDPEAMRLQARACRCSGQIIMVPLGLQL